MRWGRSEIDWLSPVLEQLSRDLSPVDGKEILVLCSATGEVAFWLAEMMEQGKVVGLELDPDDLVTSRRSAHEMGLENMVEFKPAEKNAIPLPHDAFDGVVSERIIYPTSMLAEIGQPEMARVLKPGGRMVLTDVIVTKPLPAGVREALNSIGIDYLHEATLDDLHKWMTAAGLVNIEVHDLTPTVRHVWERKRADDRSPAHQPGYSALLQHPAYGLGKAIHYIYVRGDKPAKPRIR